MESGEILFSTVDLIGVFVGALTGALVARRLGYDITGLWSLALVSGLGGGIIRDICLQDGPPLALVDAPYLPTVLVATVVGAVAGERVERSRKWITIADVIALATFAVAGSLRTIDVGLSAWSVVLLGTVTAVGGGILRDVMSGETPMIFRRGELYALAAMGGSIGVVTADALDAPRAVMILTGYAGCLVLRVGSLRFGWMSWVPQR